MTPNLNSPRTRPSIAPVKAPDLQTQLEDLLDSVWESEANWRLDDRIDLALKRRRDSRR